MAATPPLTGVDRVTFWTYRKIPYLYESGFPFRDEVEAAMRTWEEFGGVCFVPRSTETNYVEFKEAKGSNSKVGMQEGGQIVNLSNGFKALHEIGHVLGLIHEQSRSDRDNFIVPQWNHIYKGTDNENFTLITNSINLTVYDKGSVMHYPAPATGWQGIPEKTEVWTMRWKADPNIRLGGGHAQGWTNLSEMDKTAIRDLYLTVPAPMGPETASGGWKEAYQVQNPYAIGNRVFFFGQNLDERNWFIRELMPGGEIGGETDQDTWQLAYETQFTFSIAGKAYLYGQNADSKQWFISELLGNGKIGPETDSGTWGVPYHKQVPFMAGGKMYFIGQILDKTFWQITELLPGGKMGQVSIDNGSWKFTYDVLFTYSVAGQLFLYGQNMNERNWFIQEINENGKLGRETANGTWEEAYQVQFPFNINGNQYFYGQSLDSRNWFIRRLTSRGTRGEKLQVGHWKFAYGVQFPYQVGGKYYFFGQNLNERNWFIQELFDVPEPAIQAAVVGQG